MSSNLCLGGCRVATLLTFNRILVIIIFFHTSRSEAEPEIAAVGVKIAIEVETISQNR